MAELLKGFVRAGREERAGFACVGLEPGSKFQAEEISDARHGSGKL